MRLAEHERGVILRLGRLHRVAGPGSVFVIPLIDRLIRVDLRPFTLAVELPAVTSKDHAVFAARLEASCCVLQPERAVVGVEDYRSAVQELLVAIVREAAAQMDAVELQADPVRLGRAIKKIANEATLAWGVDVQAVSVLEMDPSPHGPRDTPGAG
ncbi:MAG: domain, Band 7 family protein [Cyanobacteria bacterium RYN_339]|nr:domain, Band 7 family protein [Cyanobacteria bacterium RYN_339]